MHDSVSPAPDARQSLKSLRETLLSQLVGAPTHTPNSNRAYMDRSAKRRALFPSSHADTPQSSRAGSRTYSYNSTPEHSASTPPPLPRAIGSTNVGHKLLLKQGWIPGTALGTAPEAHSSPGGDLDDMFASVSDGSTSQIRLVEPLAVVANTGRAGLGSAGAGQKTATTTRDWREEGKRRRWDGERIK